MESHWKRFEPAIGEITEKVASHYDPKKRTETHGALSRILLRKLRQHDKETILRALDLAYRHFTVRVDWTRFLCFLLSLLPGWWVKLTNDPGYDASTMLLLTDGRVMCQESGGVKWKALRPDQNGSYLNGTWSDLAPMHHTRRYYASAVLADGRVLVSGGEYSDAGSETNATEIFDPVLDTWTELSAPSGWASVGDAACAVIADGRMLMGNLFDTRTAIFDPATDSWTAGPAKGASSSEESWVLLPDDTVVTVRCDSSRRADKYVAATNTWVNGGTLPTGIVETSSSEIGAGVLLMDGRAFFAGANNHTALYTPPIVATDSGTWTMGPDFPNDANGSTVGCKDTPSCLMTNGKVLIAAGPVDGVGSHFLTPSYFFEFDGSALTRVNDPPNSTGVPYIGRMLLLPTGEILFAAQTNEIYSYQYFSCPPAAARPQITAYPWSVRPFHSYSISGRTFNGLSQAVGYGDDAAAATNYPLVRIRHTASGRVHYCRTWDHSTMGVATGSSIQSTTFFVPFALPSGPSEICVIADGVSSACCPIDVQPFDFKWPLFEEAMIARLIGSLADGPLWVLGPHGPIPVDPWGPKFRDEAKAAWDGIVSGVKTLQRVGVRLDAERKKWANSRELAPDESGEEDEDDATATGAAAASSKRTATRRAKTTRSRRR